ncbi:MAG TPA: GAF domain-containing protein, partial [Polyangia bacterium]
MNFISHETPVDLSNCDREPIHIPGQVQAHGALFAVERATGLIVQVSDNVGAFLDVAPESLLGKSLAAVLSSPDLPLAERALAQESVERSPFHLGVFERGSQRFDVIGHTDGPLAIVELDPVVSEVSAPDFYQFASRTIAGLHGIPTTSVYCQALTAAIHDLTGYDRVMVYKFADDWSGHVIAETMAPDKGLSPFLDLHYPASDIPAQARALFLKNTVRMLPDAQYQPARLVPEVNPVTGQPLDLSHAFLRGASVMYTEYLVNMGVRASLTIALTEGDRLWGL